MDNYYIDFDSTLYNTSKLTEDMLNSIAKYISSEKNFKTSDILDEIKSLFNSQNIYNIFSLCIYLEKKYLLSQNSLSDIINSILNNGTIYVYEDVISFLKKLKDKNCNIYMLTFSSYYQNTDYQLKKITGSGISEYFDSIIITAKPKHTLDLNYKNGIFIDDNPNDLQNLYNTNVKKVIRIKREFSKYSKIILNNPKIIEYTTLSEILF